MCEYYVMLCYQWMNIIILDEMPLVNLLVHTGVCISMLTLRCRQYKDSCPSYSHQSNPYSLLAITQYRNMKKYTRK